MHISSTHRISHIRLIDRRNLVGRLEKRHATNKFASVQDSSGNEYKRAVERVEKRVCFTSKHSFARIGTLVLPPPPLSPSSPIRSSLFDRLCPSNQEHTFRLDHVCYSLRSSRIRRRVASLSFPTPLGKRPPTNRTSPRVKTLNCAGVAEGVWAKGASRVVGGWEKNRSKLKQ